MSRSPRLEPAAVDAALAALPAWTLVDGALRRRLEFRDFDAALEALNRIAAVARAHDHHPDVGLVWNALTLDLRSHDAGGVTARDVALARAIDALAVDSFGA